MRVVLLLLPLAVACSGTGLAIPIAEDAGSEGLDAPPVSTEGRLFVARMPDGALHVVRVEADGAASPWGPPLDEATPPVEGVGRLLQSADGRRVLVQDDETGKTHALRGDRWEDACASLGGAQCFAGWPREDLSAFVMRRGWDDDTGVRAALVSYRGARLAAFDGRIALHSPEGWTVLTDGDVHVLWPDGSQTPLAMSDREVPFFVMQSHLLTFRNDYSRAWLRDPTTGAREDLSCPDGSPSNQIIAEQSRYQLCGGAIFGVSDAGLVATGHRTSDERGATRVLHVEPRSYTLTATYGGLVRTGEISLLAPDGRLLALEQRTYAEVDGRMSAPDVLLLDFRAEPDRLVAYARFTLYALTEVNEVLEEEHGILRWDARADSAEWHSLRHDELQSDAPSERAWFPRSADRAFWVTRDGRLLAFDYATRELVDHSGALRFEPAIDGG